MITKPSSAVLALFVVALFLLIANLSALTLTFFTGHDSAYGLSPLLDRDREHSLPTYFSVGLLMISAFLSSVIGSIERRTEPRNVFYWFLLASGFLFMSLDEWLGIHELLVTPVRTALNIENGSLLYFSWIIPAAGLVLFLALVFIPFFLRLNRQTAAIFMFAAAVYLGGAIGIEMIGGQYASMHDEQVPQSIAHLIYGAIASTEEIMEMLGAILFIHAAQQHIAYLENKCSLLRRGEVRQEPQTARAATF